MIEWRRANHGKDLLRKGLDVLNRTIQQQPFFFKYLALLTASFCLLFCALASSGAFAQDAYEPARGTAERKEVLNAVRPMVETRLNPPVEFVVDWMRVTQGWAFVSVAPQRPGGAAIDLRQTTYAGQAEYMDGVQTYALLKYQYARWNLVDFVIGPTDVFWIGDPLYDRLPAGLTPH